MTFKIHISDNPIRPGNRITIKVESNGQLRGIITEIYDPNDNKRLISRCRGNSGEFSTEFPPTHIRGKWVVKARGQAMDGSEINESEILYVEVDESQGDTPQKSTGTIEEQAMPEQQYEIDEIEGSSEESPQVQKNAEEDLQYSEQQEMVEVNEDKSGSNYEESEEISTRQDEGYIEEEPPLEEQVMDESSSTSPVFQDPLTAISGVGNATETKLIEVGITSIKQLAGADIDDVINAGIAYTQAEIMISNAKAYLSERESND